MLRPKKAPRPSNKPGMVFALGSLAAAFGVASCCALPMLLVSLGLSTAWLTWIAFTAGPHRTALIALSAVCLVVGAWSLHRQYKLASLCGPDGACAPPWQRHLTLAGLVAAATLLFWGATYA